MTAGSFALALLALSWPAPPAQPADLRNIDRTIVKEPEYAAQPFYALLVFGPEVETRVWLVLDGQLLYVDRNGNGDLTESNERIEPDVSATKKTRGEIVFNIGENAGVRLRLHTRDTLRGEPEESDVARLRPLTDQQRDLLRRYREDHKKNRWESARLMRISSDRSEMQNDVVFCQKPKDAQISHFKGPLTFINRYALAGRDEPLKKGAEEVFAVCIGTPGLATRDFGYYAIFARLTTSEVPADLHPLAEFEFPHQDPGKLPIRVDVLLDRRC